MADALGSVDGSGGAAEGTALVVASGDGAAVTEPPGPADALTATGVGLPRPGQPPVVRLPAGPGVGVCLRTGAGAGADCAGAGSDSRSSGPVTKSAAIRTSTA
ncbi:hypothetical protein [Dactylosporangium cerinum]